MRFTIECAISLLLVIKNNKILQAFIAAIALFL